LRIRGIQANQSIRPGIHIPVTETWLGPNCHLYVHTERIAMNKETTIKQVRAVLEKDPRINLHRYLAEEDDDDELSDAVRLALEKDPTQPRSASTTKGWILHWFPMRP